MWVERQGLGRVGNVVGRVHCQTKKSCSSGHGRGLQRKEWLWGRSGWGARGERAVDHRAWVVLADRFLGREPRSSAACSGGERPRYFTDEQHWISEKLLLLLPLSRWLQANNVK